MMRFGPSSNLATYAEEQKKRGRKTDARTVKRVAQAFHPYRFQVALVLTAILLTTLLVHERIMELEDGYDYAQLYYEQFSRRPETDGVGKTDNGVLTSTRRDSARFLSDSAPTAQTVPTLETQTPYLQLLEDMMKKTASSIPQPAIEITGKLPVLSAADFRPSVPQEPAFMQNARPKLLSRPRLLISSSLLDETYEVLLKKDIIAIGESDSNDIVLRGDYMTAPYHALLEKRDGDYYLFEWCCKGGVIINGQKLVLGLGYKLANGDQIVIGQYRLIFFSVPPQKLTKPMANASTPKRVTLPRMLTLPAKRNY